MPKVPRFKTTLARFAVLRELSLYGLRRLQPEKVCLSAMQAHVGHSCRIMRTKDSLEAEGARYNDFTARPASRNILSCS